MRIHKLPQTFCWPLLCAGFLLVSPPLLAQYTISLDRDGDARTYTLTSKTPLRDPHPPDNRLTINESPAHARLRTGNLLFDGLYAMAVSEALANSVPQISDGGFAHGAPIALDAFQTGEFWTYVWTRDLSYSVNLALAGFDPPRAVNSLLFKTSVLKASVPGKASHQIIQDTGSGGSYPVSTDRVVWALGADETLKYLAPAPRRELLEKVYPILCDTIEQDRRLIFDPRDGLYRGEESFLDWREQTYPGWTRSDVLAIGMSKSLSVNVANYFLLCKASDYAGRLGQAEDRARFAGFAGELKTAVNRHFFDEKTGLHSAYLFSEDGSITTERLPRYDLLGESLAILCGVADPAMARSIIGNYPVGVHGPPVVWPQERSVDIYHNQAMWPFVTAYWLRAARQVGNVAAVNAGIRSLQQQAALNLSNMENYDLVTGSSHVTGQKRNGPVINSRRQLWSVAAYLSMVQDVVFGLEASWEGVRFRPFITVKMREDTFRNTDVIELRDWTYQETHNRVLVHLPAAGAFPHGVCVVEHVELNGQQVGVDEFVPPPRLQADNAWEIYLKLPDASQPEAVDRIKLVDVSREAMIFAPVQPQWKDDRGGVSLEDGHAVLDYAHEDLENVTFNIYRDGALYAAGVRQTKWTDPKPDDHATTVHSYAVAAVDLRSGNVSHLTRSRSLRDESQQITFPAKTLVNRGGTLVDDRYFKDWGRPDHELSTPSFRVPRGGRYLVRAEFSNGGPLITGLTCGIKKVELREAAAVSGEVVAGGYLLMPHSGDWKRWDLSSSVEVVLRPDTDYVLRLSEDEYSRNMSYFKNNERYTSANGGGESSYNFVNIAALHLLYTAER